jgi:hypothetical protein
MGRGMMRADVEREQLVGLALTGGLGGESDRLLAPTVVLG